MWYNHLSEYLSKEWYENNDIEPRSINECQQRNDWPKWKEAIQVELNSLKKTWCIWTYSTNTKECKPGRF